MCIYKRGNNFDALIEINFCVCSLGWFIITFVFLQFCQYLSTAAMYSKATVNVSFDKGFSRYSFEGTVLNGNSLFQNVFESDRWIGK